VLDEMVARFRIDPAAMGRNSSNHRNLGLRAPANEHWAHSGGGAVLIRNWATVFP